jgi:vitamin B12 transporter
VKRIAICLVSSFLLTAALTAQPQQNNVGDTIVVTASGIPETAASTPAAVTVITRDEIEQQGARDVADVLRQVPGLTLMRSGSPGKSTSLFSRGANSQQTLVLWNGIEINDPYFSGYDWGRFSTAGVEQVEVVRGPFSSLYGSEAMAGVVNVLTVPGKSGFHGAFEAGTHGLRNGILDGAYITASSLLSGSLERRQDDGFDPNDDFAQTSANLFWRWSPLEHFSIGLAGRRTTYDLGIPFDLNATLTALVPSLQRRQSGNERQLAIPVRQTIGSFSYDLTLAESRRDDRFADPDDPFGTTSSDTTSRTRRARLTTRTSAGALGTLVAGAEVERATVDDRTNFGPNFEDKNRSSRAFYIEDRWSHETAAGGHFELSAGLRYDHFSGFGNQTSPRVALAWVTSAGKWRAAYGSAFRAPSVGELYYPFSGNPDLEAESSRSLEAGYDAYLSKDRLLSVTAFTSSYRDLIVFDNATLVFGNVGRAKADGLELGASGRLTPALHVSASYTWLHKDDNEITGERLLRRPEHSGSLTFAWRSGNLDAALAVIHAGQRVDVLPILPFTHVNNRAYTTADLNLGLHLGGITPFVRLENLRNERYQEVLGFQSPGRRTVVGIRF